MLGKAIREAIEEDGFKPDLRNDYSLFVDNLNRDESIAYVLLLTEQTRSKVKIKDVIRVKVPGPSGEYIVKQMDLPPAAARTPEWAQQVNIRGILDGTISWDDTPFHDVRNG